MIRTPRQRSERGAVLIIVALCITAIFLFLALVIDLGATRSERRGAQVAVDNAVASATQTLAKDEDIVAACEEAFEYLALNLDAADFTGDDCASALAGDCIDDPQTPERFVEKSSENYVAVLVHPVGNTSSLMRTSTVGSTGPSPTDEEAGPPCERIGLQILTTGDSYFGGVAGVNERESLISAVGRADAGNTELQALNLLVLERHDCDAFTVGSNNTKVVVAAPAEDNPDTEVDERTLPGIAATDSDGRDCTGANDTMEVNGNGAQIRAEGVCDDDPSDNSCGQIDLWAPVSDVSCSSTTDAEQFSCDEGQGSISPDVGESLFQYTRAPVDYRYNCKLSYVSEPWYSGLEQDIPKCPNATAASTTDYVDQLKFFALNTARTNPTFTVINSASDGGCSPPSKEYGQGNYFVDCPNFRVNSGSQVAFLGGNVVFSGNVVVQNNSSLEMHKCARTGAACTGSIAWSAGANFLETQWSSAASWMFVNGKVTVSSGSGPSAIPGLLQLNRTALFIGMTGDLSQTGTVRSEAPDAGICGTPTCAGPFDDLALWSEGSTPHTFRGGGANTFEGLYFGGRAHFALSGGTDVTLTSAQFVANTIAFNGGVTFTMSPVGDRSVLFDVPATYSLIR